MLQINDSICYRGYSGKIISVQWNHALNSYVYAFNLVGFVSEFFTYDATILTRSIYFEG